MKNPFISQTPFFAVSHGGEFTVFRRENPIQRDGCKATERLRGEDAALLDSIAGVGPVTAAAFPAAVGDPATFGSAREAGPYFGLVPRRDQSGATDKQLRISKEGNQAVRRLLVTAANYIMGSFGKDCDLRRHGMRIAERGGKNARKRAKVAVARKLAVVMLAVLRNRTVYRPLAEDTGPAAQGGLRDPGENFHRRLSGNTR